MRFVLALLYLAVFIAFGFSASVTAGPVLDDLLNYPVVDQYCPSSENPAPEGLKLIGRGKVHWMDLTREQSLGQTFTVGKNAERIWTIHLGICHWPSSWQEGEEITFTLYDGPAKGKKLYSKTIGFDHKWHKWDIPFNINVPVKPSQTLYFELTLGGTGADGIIQITSAPGAEYQLGQAYINGKPVQDKDLTFTLLVKNKPDIKANRQKFLSRFDLDHPALADAKAAAAKNNFDGACKAILKAFEDRLLEDDQTWRLKPGDSPNITRAEKVMLEGKLYKNATETKIYIPMGPQTNWREVWPDSPDYVRQNDLFRDLGFAYAHTKDERYAAKLNELMADFNQDNNSPLTGGFRGGRWVSMFQAWRLGDAWDGWANAIGSKGLTDDVKLAWIDYNWRSAMFAEEEHAGANQANAKWDSLMQFGLRFPFYKDSQRWIDKGLDQLIENSLDLFREDGGSKERAMNYHGYALSTLIAGLDRAKKHEKPVKPEIYKRLEKALEFTAYMITPNGQIPSYGDTNAQDFRSGVKHHDGWRRGEVMQGYQRFGRKDLLFIATAGKEGERPAFDSYAYPDTGFYVLRSGWGGKNGEGFEDERHLMLMGGQYGGHSHWDQNQVLLYAYGRPLIIDPGRTKYGTPLMFELEKPRSHNVLLVDGEDMQKAAHKVYAWERSPMMDVVDIGYENIYPGVAHRRAIVFVRPDYYVMFDSVSSDKPRKMGINFWLTPPVSAKPSNDAGKSARLFGTDPEGANVCLDVTGSSAIELAQRNGTLDLADKLWEMPVATFWQTSQSKADFITVMYPSPKGADDAGHTVVSTVDGDTLRATVTTADGVDIITYRYTADKPQSSVIRMDSAGKPAGFAMSNSGELKAGQILAKSPEAVSILSVKYLPDSVEVSCPDSISGLEIAALGRKSAIVNGTKINISGDMFAPFAK